LPAKAVAGRNLWRASARVLDASGSRGIGHEVARSVAESDARLLPKILAVAAGAKTECHVVTAEEGVRAMRLVDTCYKECRPAGSRGII
jgi:hypothetical protein